MNLPQQKEIKLSISVVVLIIGLIVSGAVGMQALWQKGQMSQARCIADVEKDTAMNTKRIEALERLTRSMSDLPPKIAGMSSDIRYLRHAVERIEKQWSDSDDRRKLNEQ